MKSYNPVQETLLRSAVQNALESCSEEIILSIIGEEESDVRFTLFIQEEGCRYVGSSDLDEPYNVSKTEVPKLVLERFQEVGSYLLIDNGEQVVRYGMRKNSVIRETLPARQSILKQPSWAIGKTTHLEPNEAASLLQAIGLMTGDGEIKAPMRKKFKQVNHFLDLLVPVLEEETGKDPYSIVDCGCGKSYLSFVLFWYIKKVLKKPAVFFGIDVSELVIETSRQRADDLQLGNMQFQCSPNRDADFPHQIDLLVSLHACDTATDEAIACGVVHKAVNIVVAPCCQHEIATQIDGVPMYPIRRHGIFKQRFGDLLTDMTRSLFLEANGYSVTAGEFIGVEETPKNLLLKAKRGNANTKIREQEYRAFKEFYSITPSIDRFQNDLELRKHLI